MLSVFLAVLSMLAVPASTQRYARAEETLFRDQVPSRPPRHKPTVANPFDYDVYFDPVVPASVGGGAPLLANNIVRKPAFVAKPFEPRPPKQVKPLQPNGPVLYSTPLDAYDRPALSEHQQDLRNVPGYPGQDYPLFAQVPPTRFSCDSVPIRPGLYADPETGCQAYHVCGEDGRHGDQGASFLCTNGTVFNQPLLTCDWWYNVDCQKAVSQYEVNLDPYKNPLLYVPEKQQPVHSPSSDERFFGSPARGRPDTRRRPGTF